MSPFLTADWLKLAMFNYEVDPGVLKTYIPPKTELDLFNGTCYISLIGFRFWNTHVKKLAIPFHTHFEEINLRFYVRCHQGGEWKRGVAFIKEIVPKVAITFIANVFYDENYESMPTSSTLIETNETITVKYQWGRKLSNNITVIANNTSLPIKEQSEEEFITEHYWGYAKAKNNTTNEYQVEHPRWNIYPVKEYSINCDFEKLYGPPFSILQQAKPLSVLLAEGSAIKIFPGKKI